MKALHFKISDSLNDKLELAIYKIKRANKKKLLKKDFLAFCIEYTIKNSLIARKSRRKKNEKI